MTVSWIDGIGWPELESLNSLFCSRCSRVADEAMRAPTDAPVRRVVGQDWVVHNRSGFPVRDVRRFVQQTASLRTVGGHDRPSPDRGGPLVVRREQLAGKKDLGLADNGVKVIVKVTARLKTRRTEATTRRHLQ
jgi:hypothetical protein